MADDKPIATASTGWYTPRMHDSDDLVERHYGAADLETRIVSGLDRLGKDLNRLSVDDLAPVDAFHVRGRAATEELAGWADIGPRDVVLDIGCGLGGTARYLADRFGCRVDGVDLTRAYCEVAESMSGRVGLSGLTRFHHSSALNLPFSDGRFDVVWTEHVQMNIADKGAFYAEARRVLRGGGQLVFHDVFAANGEMRYPVPWAEEPSISHLAAAAEVRELLEAIGLRVVRWEDTTERSIAFFHERLPRLRGAEVPPLGLHVIMGEGALEKFENMLAILESGAVTTVQAVLRNA